RGGGDARIGDPQIHRGTGETPERPWIRGGQTRAHLPEPLTYQRYLPLMAEAGVDRAIIVPPTWPLEENEHALEAASRHPDRFALMGRFAIGPPQSPGLLPTWKSQEGLLRVRLALNPEKTRWIVDGKADWFWPVAEEHDIPVMLFAPDAPEAIGPIARDHPNLRLIIDHMGLATRGPELKRVRERIALIAPLA